MKKTLALCPLTGARLSLSYIEIDAESRLNTFQSHTPDRCEVYINLSGDVSFVVENNIYPIAPGSVIITRPGEFHHCVYHSNALHKHFWILFSADRMEEIFSRFYDRPAGEKDLLELSGSRLEEMVALCHAIDDVEVSQDEALYRFFRFIHLINETEVSVHSREAEAPFMRAALAFIHNNLSSPFTVKEVAQAAYVSVATLERHFKSRLQMSPSEYLKKRRLAHAARLLQEGATVTEACHGCGFLDCSKFILLFKKHYGATPLQYKKAFAAKKHPPV